MDAIEAFINSPFGISIQTFQGKYWTQNGPHGIKASKSARDRFTKFWVTKLSNNKISLRTDTQKILSVIGENREMQCCKSTIDKWCEFSVYDVSTEDDAGNVTIALRTVDGRFISQWDAEGLQGLKDGIDQFCKFTIGYGSFLDPTFEIIDVQIHDTADDLSWKPEVVEKTTYINKSSYPISQRTTMEYSKQIIETTTWNNAWKTGTSISHKVGVESVSRGTFEMEITAGGSTGGSSSTTNTVKYSRITVIKAAVGKKTVASLVAKRTENAKIGFTATIRRKLADGTTDTFKESGFWTGAMYDKFDVNVIEEDM